MSDTNFGAAIRRNAIDAWDALAPFRATRERNKNYTFGRQWEDIVTIDGRSITEREYIISEGHTPLKNNLIRRIVRNVVGVFRRQLAESMAHWDEKILRLASANSLYEVYARSMEEFLISGLVVHKKWVGKKNGRPGIWTDVVSPLSFFFNPSARDPDGADLSLIGQFHDVSFPDFCMAFVKGNADFEAAGNIFADSEMLRVAEVWRRECVTCRRRNDPSRVSLREVWRYYFILPDGRVIASGRSPYPHGSHPYIFKAYPFIDGEIHSLVNDTIDQQRYTNRLITMYDWVIRSSAKGVLLVPSEGYDDAQKEAIADQWSRYNGVIFYEPRPGQPDLRQINAANSNMAIGELLAVQLKMLEDVSGVNGALQGNLDNNSVSGTLYSRQTENALTSLRDVLDAFASFISAALEVDRSLISHSPFFQF